MLEGPVREDEMFGGGRWEVGEAATGVVVHDGDGGVGGEGEGVAGWEGGGVGAGGVGEFLVVVMGCGGRGGGGDAEEGILGWGAGAEEDVDLAGGEDWVSFRKCTCEWGGHSNDRIRRFGGGFRQGG